MIAGERNGAARRGATDLVLEEPEPNIRGASIGVPLKGEVQE
jgi:hypothetical protein